MVLIHMGSIFTGVDWLVHKISRYHERSVRNANEMKWLPKQKFGIYVICFFGKDDYRGRSKTHAACVHISASDIFDFVDRYAL